MCVIIYWYIVFDYLGSQTNSGMAVSYLKKTHGRGGAMSELLSRHNEHRGKEAEKADIYREELIRKKRNSIFEEIHRSEEELGGAEERVVQKAQQPPQKLPQRDQRVRRAVPPVAGAAHAPKVKPAAPRPARVDMARPAPQPPVMPRPEGAPVRRPQRPVPEKRARRKSGGAFIKAALALGMLLVLAAAITVVVLLIRPEEEMVAPAPEINIGAVDVAIDETTPRVSLSSSAGHSLQMVSFSIYGDDSITCLTDKTTVGEIVDEVGIELNDSQVIRDDTSAETGDGMIICIDTVTYKTETFTEYADYSIRYVDVQFIPRGQEKIHFKGSMGEKVTTYKIKYVNGKVAEKTELSNVITKAPLTQVVYRGVGGTITVGGKQYSYSHFIDCKTTVYNLEGITASGKPVGYDVIAVDPRVIPLGTKVFVDDPYTYVGFREAADTGGAIKGNFIDIWFKKGDPKFSKYGVRSARVYILD